MSITSREIREWRIPSGRSIVAAVYVEELMGKEDTWNRRADWAFKHEEHPRIPRMYAIYCMLAAQAALEVHYHIKRASPKADLIRAIRRMQRCDQKAEKSQTRLQQGMKLDRVAAGGQRR